MARNAAAARRARQKVNPDQLAPKIAQGLTQGVSVKEALEEHPVDPRPSGIEIARDFASHARKQEEDPRYRGVSFIARLDPSTKVIEPNTGRTMIDAEIVMTPADRQKILAGLKCISCLEEFDHAFPLRCPLCDYEVRDKQIARAAFEFEGETHVGPKKPLRELLDKQQERMEKRDFILSVLEGGQGRIPKEWLRDATLLEGLSEEHRAMIGGR